MSVFDSVFHIAKIVASSVGSVNASTLYNLAGVGAFRFDAEGNVVDIDDDDDDKGEVATEQKVFTALGLVGRPLPPEGDLFANALCAREDDGLVPFAFRDLRIHRALNPAGGSAIPAPGQLIFAGYGGGFHSQSQTAADSGDQKADIQTFYCPYQFTDGVAAKAHSITMDPTTGNESISIVHGDGFSITMTTESLVLRNAAGDVYLELNADEFVVNGNMKVRGGFQTLDPAGTPTLLPLAKSTELLAWSVAVATWQTAVVAALSALGQTVPPPIPLVSTVATVNTFGF